MPRTPKAHRKKAQPPAQIEDPEKAIQAPLPPEERARLEAYRDRLREHSCHRPPSVRPRKGSKELEPEGDPLLYLAALSEATGTVNRELGLKLSEQVRLCSPDWFRGTTDNHNVALAMLHGIAPKNELEGMIGVQMVAAHNLAMEFMRRSMVSEQPSDMVDSNVNRATKLLRAFTAQLEALGKLRGMGQQRITVEHVTVNEGGQAFVGNLAPRGGLPDKADDLPHAKRG